MVIDMFIPAKRNKSPRKALKAILQFGLQNLRGSPKGTMTNCERILNRKKPCRCASYNHEGMAAVVHNLWSTSGTCWWGAEGA